MLNAFAHPTGNRIVLAFTARDQNKTNRNLPFKRGGSVLGQGGLCNRSRTICLAQHKACQARA
jgi:hypothetical protein